MASHQQKERFTTASPASQHFPSLQPHCHIHSCPFLALRHLQQASPGVRSGSEILQKLDRRGHSSSNAICQITFEGVESRTCCSRPDFHAGLHLCPYEQSDAISESLFPHRYLLTKMLTTGCIILSFLRFRHLS